MNAKAAIDNGRGSATFVRPRSATVGQRRISRERGGRMPLAWWGLGAAIAALAALAIAATLLRWVTLD